MKFAAVLSAGAAAASVAQVEDYIANQRCLEQYIRFSKPACVANGECFEPGSNGCTDVTQWQWPGHEAGVNPHPRNRVTKNGHDQQKTVWTYSGAVDQGEAMQIYARIGADGQRSATQVTAEGVLNTPVNMISFIANVLIDQPAQWFRPGHNNTNGCGQEQTWELPFGFEGNSTTALPKFQKNLKLMHENGKTITMTMGSWCTSFPVLPSEEWSEENFGEFVDYFKHIRETTFGGFLDGIDFDWEGYCSQECLKGANACHCDWDDQICGEKTPEELAAGVRWSKAGSPVQYECWRMATKSTIQVLTGITYHMKQAGFVVTIVPMSTQVYSGEEDATGNQVMRNEMVKYRKQPYAGGKAIAGSTQVDLMDVADGVLLQWYSGFDASLCKHGPAGSCSCNNVPDKDYPNELNLSNGLITSYWSINGSDGNMFPTTFPIRCEACSGTSGPNACSSKEEAWFKVCNENQTTCVDSHKAGLQNYSAHHNHTENWWVEGLSVNSKCPRSIDCPDWQYEQEQRYSRQLNLLQSIAKVVDISKVSIGFEVLGIDVQVQMHAYVDPALPWTDVTPDQLHKEKIYYKDCHVNMTAENEAQEMRCAQPLLAQQWGPKFVAKDVVGLDEVIKAKLGAGLAGVGFFTLDGVIAVPHGEKARYWRPQLLELNETWAHIPGTNVPIPGPTPLPPQPSLGFCTKFAQKNACGPCNEESDCGINQGSACWKAKDANCGVSPSPSPGPAPGPASKPYFCMHSSPQNACGSCATPADCGGSDWGLCWATKDAQCPAAFEATLLNAVSLASPKLTLKKPAQCDKKFACCREGSTEFCSGKAKLAFCDPKAMHTDRAVPHGEGCVCPYNSKFDHRSKECKGSFGPTPTEFYCVHNAEKNSCGACKTPEDCGGNSTAWDLCWASKDTACPKELTQLVV